MRRRAAVRFPVGAHTWVTVRPGVPPCRFLSLLCSLSMSSGEDRKSIKKAAPVQKAGRAPHRMGAVSPGGGAGLREPGGAALFTYAVPSMPRVPCAGARQTEGSSRSPVCRPDIPPAGPGLLSAPGSNLNPPTSGALQVPEGGGPLCTESSNLVPRQVPTGHPLPSTDRKTQREEPRAP